MRKSKSDVQFYIELVNKNFDINLCLTNENGTNTIRTSEGNEPVFTGTIKECYYFLVGLSRIKLNK